MYYLFVNAKPCLSCIPVVMLILKCLLKNRKISLYMLCKANFKFEYISFFQNWFKGQRKVDRRRVREVAKGDASEFLVELEKTQSVFQLCKTSQKRKRDLAEAETHSNSTSNEGPPNTVRETLRVLKEEPRLTPSVWPHPPLSFAAPTLDSVSYGFPALTSALPMTTSKTPKKEVSFFPTLTESSSVKNSLRIKNPFEEDPTPTKKRRKLSNDVTRFVHSVDTVMEDILNGTSPLLPHIDSFLWGTDGPRFM